MCEAETVRAVHEQERWHNEALKQARGIEVSCLLSFQKLK